MDLDNLLALSDHELNSFMDSLPETSRLEVMQIIEAEFHHKQNELQEAAAQSLAAFAQYINPRYILEPFHQSLFDHLEAVLRGDINRLMIFAPPQHGKTEAVSVVFPAYWLAHRPYDSIILASYAADLARDKSGDARSIVASERYGGLHPNHKISAVSRAMDTWKLANTGGGMRARGVGGPITGHPAHLAIIDDPVKGYAEASSEAIQNSNWHWYDSTLYSRLQEDAPVILIMTRWHELDLAGRILNEREGKRFTVLRYPALAESQEARDAGNVRLGLEEGLPDPLGRQEGEALAPERFSRQYLEHVRDNGTAYRWGALYQGVPRPAEGNIIKRAWLQIVDEVPWEAERIRYWDLAGTRGGGARTAGILMARSTDGKYYIEDAVFGQWSFGERNKVMEQTAAIDAMNYVRMDPENPEAELWEMDGYNTVRIYIEQEPGASGKEVIQSLVKRLSGFAAFGDRPTGSKDDRIRPFAAQAEIEQVYIKRATWNAVVIDELASFPNGQYRDIGDAVSGAFNLLHTKPGFVMGVANPPDDEDRWV